MSSKWTVRLKEYPSAPPLNVSLAGPMGAPARDYDTAALRSFFVVKGLTEGVQQLEKLQREEEERIARLEEMERKAKIDQARREEERLNAPEPGLLAPEEPESDTEPDDDSPQSQAPVDAEADDSRVARTQPEPSPDPTSTQSIDPSPGVDTEQLPLVPEQALPELAVPEPDDTVAHTDPDPDAP